MVPLLRRKPKQNKPLTEGEKNRRLLLRAGVQMLFWVMGAIVVIFAIVSALLGSSLFLPRSAQGVLDSVETPAVYTWSSESIRVVNLGSEEQEQHAARSATVDTERNKFQVVVAGVLPERTLFVSDANSVISIDETAQANGSPWTLVTDVCQGADAIPVSTLEMPTPEMFKTANPEIVSDEATVLGERAWEISFDLTPEIISQMLWLDFFEQAAGDDFEWVMSEEEIEKIQNGEFTTDKASVWVTRDNRELSQIDVRFEIEDGSKWRLLSQQVPSQEEDPLASTDLGDPCSQEVSP